MELDPLPTSLFGIRKDTVVLIATLFLTVCFVPDFFPHIAAAASGDLLYRIIRSKR
jgi:hypothetical protein